MYHPDMGSLAQFVGERPYESPAFAPGVDFDPYDPDEVEIVGLATETHRHDRMRRLEEENSSLRARLAELTGEEE